MLLDSELDAQPQRGSRRGLLLEDIFLILMMGTLAACGIIYEYLMAHYAGRVLGSLESTIYAMIGLMIVAMGVGAFLAKWIKRPFIGFVWLELAIGFVGATSVLVISVSVSLAFSLPAYLQEIYGLHPSITTNGGVVRSLSNIAKVVPFVAGGLLGLMIGMEIPLIARIREQLHGQHLQNNVGTIYGADYVGAGIGAAVWVLVCLQLPIVTVALTAALVNALVGVGFLLRYRQQLSGRVRLWIAHGVLLLLIGLLAAGGVSSIENLRSALFKDQVVYSKNTPYQNLTVTERLIGKGVPKVTSLYINGRLQFSSSDELIYHSYLTYPVLAASARHDRLLVIGGGDGLALRELLRWNPESVTLIDLDQAMVDLFAGRDGEAPTTVGRRLRELNGDAFNDPRLELIAGDAFVEVEKLVSDGRHFDAIIVDLPDPSHPDINKVYSDFFYARLRELLSGDGAIAVQSTSPFHTRNAFISIGKTLASAGFITEQYHANVPTFGEWGWTIGTVMGSRASVRLAQGDEAGWPTGWLSKQQMLAAFVFAPNFFDNKLAIKVNQLGSHRLYQYHQKAWVEQDGVFFAGGGAAALSE